MKFNMKLLGRGEQGVTLVELLITAAIICVIGGTVVPNVVGMQGKGGVASYESDCRVIQLAVTSDYYLDKHAGLVYDPNQDGIADDTRWGCNCTDEGEPGFKLTQTFGSYYPTALAYPSSHTLYTSDITDPYNDEYQAFVLVGGSGMPGCANCATDKDISVHAIWMGLLINKAGDYNRSDNDGNCDARSECGTTDRKHVSTLPRERSRYLQEMPDSAMAGDDWNGATEPGGTYCWIVGKNGKVYGAYKGGDGRWYAGFSGAYP